MGPFEHKDVVLNINIFFGIRQASGGFFQLFNIQMCFFGPKQPPAVFLGDPRNVFFKDLNHSGTPLERRGLKNGAGNHVSKFKSVLCASSYCILVEKIEFWSVSLIYYLGRGKPKTYTITLSQISFRKNNKFKEEI